MLACLLPDDAWGQALDHRTNAGRAEAFVVLAPADDAGIRGEFHVVVIAPAGIAGERLDLRYFHSEAVLLLWLSRRGGCGWSSTGRLIWFWIFEFFQVLFAQLIGHVAVVDLL